MISTFSPFKRIMLTPFKRLMSPGSYVRLFRKARKQLRELRQAMMSQTLVELARRTWRELGDDYAVDLAASISYYAILSLFPLAIGLVTLFSLVMEAEAVEQEVFGFFHTYLPGSEGILAANVEAVGERQGITGGNQRPWLALFVQPALRGHYQGSKPGLGYTP